MAEAPEEEQKEEQKPDEEVQGDEELNLDPESTRSQKIKKWIKIIALILLVGVGAVSYIFIKMSQEEPTIRQLTPMSADGTVVDPDAAPEAGLKLPEKTTKGKANYYNITPSFIINVLSRDDKRHYIQFDISIMTRDSSLFYKLEHHDPVIKSVVLTVASSQSYESLATIQGREKFRDELLGELRTRLEELTGSKGVEEVLFTKFIME